MAFPLGAIGMGLNLVGGITGLFGANDAIRRQQEAEAAAIRDLEASGEADYSATRGSGERGLYGLTGTLSDALARGGRGLGAAMAGAGVYNSSATAGARANQDAANAGALGQYTSGLADTLARIRSQTNQQVAQMRYGMAANELNFARQQQAGAVSGVGSFLGQLGQFGQAATGTRAQSPRQQQSGPGNQGSVLDIPSLGYQTPPIMGYQPYSPPPGGMLSRGGFGLGRPTLNSGWAAWGRGG